MAGKLYGVGVGPGDPQLLTIKALRVIKECDIIAVPGKIAKDTVAYKIVEEICPEIEKKELLGIYMPMTKDKKVLETSHAEGVSKLREQLDAGKNIAFLTLGDPTVYSTYMYLHGQIDEEGYDVEIVSGIPSFCAAAARLGISIAQKAEQIHIIPASYQVEDALELSGTKIFMKAGGKLPAVKENLKEHPEKVYAVENCGMADEHVYYGADELPENAGYYTLVIAKNEKKRGKCDEVISTKSKNPEI